MFSRKKKHDSKPLLYEGFVDHHDVIQGDCNSNPTSGGRLVVLGATGSTGKHVVEQALRRGYTVTAVVRDGTIETGAKTNENLKICSADIFSAPSLAAIFKDQDAILSCLGNVETSTWSPTTFYTDSMTQIIEAMRETGVPRLVCITAWYTNYGNNTSNLQGKLSYWSEKPFHMLVKGTLDNMGQMESYICSCDDINYTIIRPPTLTDGPLSENIITNEGQRVTYNSLLKSCRSGIISRASVAHFMLDCLEMDRWDRKGVAVDQKR